MLLKISIKLKIRQKLWSNQRQVAAKTRMCHHLQDLQQHQYCGTRLLSLVEIMTWARLRINQFTFWLWLLLLFLIWLDFIHIRLNLARFRPKNEENGLKQKMASKRGLVDIWAAERAKAAAQWLQQPIPTALQLSAPLWSRHLSPSSSILLWWKNWCVTKSNSKLWILREEEEPWAAEARAQRPGTSRISSNSRCWWFLV